MNLEDKKQLLEHLKAGYENSQQVVKALDAKAGILSGFVILILTGLIGTAKWIHESQISLDLSGDITAFFFWLSLAANVGSLSIALCSLVKSVSGAWKKDSFHILFPAYKPEQENVNMAHKVLNDDLTCMLGYQIQEYRDQLFIMGNVLRAKLGATNTACLCLQVSIVSTLTLAGATFCSVL